MALGECDSNRDWMLDHCFRSCTRCYTAGEANSYFIKFILFDANFGQLVLLCCLAFLVDCYNSHDNDADCDYWAASGECQSNFNWMTYHCEESCHTCPLFTPRFAGLMSLTEVLCIDKFCSYT